MTTTDPTGSADRLLWQASEKVTPIGACVKCAIENFSHNPDDPHMVHGLHLCGVKTNYAVTVYNGDAICSDHLLGMLNTIIIIGATQ